MVKTKQKKNAALTNPKQCPISQKENYSKKRTISKEDPDMQPKVTNGLNPENNDRRDRDPEYLLKRAERILKINENFKETAKNGMIDCDQFSDNLGHHVHSFFAERLFYLFDENNDGRISIEEFQDKILKFETKSDKIDLLFDIYDIQGTGELEKSEVTQIFHAMVQESNLRLSEDEIDKLSLIFMKEAREYDMVFNKKKVTKEAFRRMLLETKSLSDDVSTLIDHWIGFVEDETEETSPPTKEDLIIDMATVTPSNSSFNVCMILYVVIIGIMMIIAGFLYKDAKDREGNTNFYYIGARIFGFPLNLIGTMVFVFMIHPILDFCRERGWNRLLPLDHNLTFHMVSGYLILSFGILHTAAHCANFKLNVQPDPENYFIRNNKTLNEIGFNQPRVGGNYSYSDWMFTTKPHLFGWIPGTANISGVILNVILILMVLTSQNCIRRRGFFNIFFYCHLLYLSFAILLLLHAPSFHWYFFGVIVYLVIHFFTRMTKGYARSFASLAIMLPSKVVCLVIPKPRGMSFATGDYISVNAPELARYEWHPFTISSSPDIPDVFTLHIKVVGSWTEALMQRIERDRREIKDNIEEPSSLAELRLLPHEYTVGADFVPYDAPEAPLTDVVIPAQGFHYQVTRSTNPILLRLNGPFHAPANEFFNSEHAVMIATGIGVTPMTSILHTLQFRQHCIAQNWPDYYVQRLQGNLKKVDFIWIVRDPTEVTWFMDMLTQIEIEKEEAKEKAKRNKIDLAFDFIDIHVYVTKALAETDMCAVTLRIAMDLYHSQHGKYLAFGGLKSNVITGRPNLTKIFHDLYMSKRGNIDVFFCGNSKVGDIVEEKCREYEFSIHREVF